MGDSMLILQKEHIFINVQNGANDSPEELGMAASWETS